MKDKTNQNEKVNIINQEYKEEISKETLTKGMIAGALAVGAVGSMEAIKPTVTAQADVFSSAIGFFKTVFKSSTTLLEKKHGDFEDKTVRATALYNSISDFHNQYPDHNIIIIADKMEGRFVNPQTMKTVAAPSSPIQLKLGKEKYTAYIWQQGQKGKQYFYSAQAPFNGEGAKNIAEKTLNAAGLWTFDNSDAFVYMGKDTSPQYQGIYNIIQFHK
ncbi:hypothetical protein [Bacillus sp. FSL R12-0069]|uniref:hypothetical protein n=1 Tax=Bacillus sp. FSL R12-0069 TaxID=2975342 RepID=UPI0030FC6459